jgi:hypothetical protein
MGITSVHQRRCQPGALPTGHIQRVADEQDAIAPVEMFEELSRRFR